MFKNQAVEEPLEDPTDVWKGGNRPKFIWTVFSLYGHKH